MRSGSFAGDIIASEARLSKSLMTVHSKWRKAFVINQTRIAMTTTNEIADKIASEHSLTKAQGKAIVEAVFAEITSAAVSGTETSIPGFGKFKVKDTPEREARNPATGATIKVAAAKKLAFSPAKALKDTLNK
jgi:DNA-binding protein HU-beta